MSREEQQDSAAGGGAVHGPGMRFFAELTGKDVDDAAADPRGTLRGGLKALARELAPIAEGARSDDPERRREAEARAEALRARLEGHHGSGPDAATSRQAAKDEFQQRLNTTLRDAVAKLERLRDEVIVAPHDQSGSEDV